MKKVFLLLVCLTSLLSSLWAQEETYTATDLYNLAGECVKVGNYDDAISYLSDAKKLDPMSSDIYALSSAIMGDYIVQEIAKGKASNDTILSLIPYCLSDMNNAIQFWTNKADRSLSVLYFTRGFFLKKLGYYEKAFADLNVAHENLKKDEYKLAIDVLRHRAEIFKASGYATNYQLDMSEAITYCKRGTKNDPTDVYYYDTRANIEHRMGFDKLMIETIFNRLEKIPVKDYDEIDGYEKALILDIAYCKKLVDKKLKKDPNNPAWLYIQALISFYSRDYVLALQQYDAMINKVGPAYRLYHAKFLCYHDTRCYDKGMAVLEKMEQLYDSIDVDDTYYKMQLHAIKGEHEKVVEIADKLIDTYGYNANVLLNRAYSYQAMNQDAKAMIDLNTVIANEPTHAQAYLKRTRLHRKYGALEMAKLDDEMVLKYDTICDASSVRHYSLFFLGQEEEAIKWVDGIVAGSPKSIGRHYDRACLMSLMGKTDEALKSLRTAMELGFGDFDHLMHDEDLNNLRQLPEFIELVAKYQQVHDDFCSKLVDP